MLLANLGTPSAPSAPAVRAFLRELLTDSRLVDKPRWLWWPILNLFILPSRPRAYASVYRSIWGSSPPLLKACHELRDAVASALERQAAPVVHVAIGMRYGVPSIREAMRELRGKGCTRVLILPLFPQYSSATIGSAFAAAAAELATWRVVPALRTIHGYHDEPAYVEALADSIRETWKSGGEPERLLFSFHSLPLRHILAGDPYYFQCRETAEQVASALDLTEERYEVSFQSVFGRDEWVKPATAYKVRAMARAGVTKLDVICPGFSVDCLETLWEIDQESRNLFLTNGGARFRYIRCLNARPEHVRMLTALVQRNLAGWIPRPAVRSARDIAVRRAAVGAGSAGDGQQQRSSIQ
ncbi:MAG TPA: ferrochelatase [Gammaproteobacteria bacterium]